MKKIVKRPDGTEEVVEGTAQELAEYERRQRGDVNETPKRQRRVLTEGEVRELLDSLRLLPDVVRDAREHMFCSGCPTCRGPWFDPGAPYITWTGTTLDFARD